MSDPASIISHVTSADQEQRHGHPGRIVWLTGLSGAGKARSPWRWSGGSPMPDGMSTCSMATLRGGLCSISASRE